MVIKWILEHLFEGLLALGVWGFLVGLGILVCKMENYRQRWLESERKLKHMERKIKNESEDDIIRESEEDFEREVERGPFRCSEEDL